jgi:malate synthase
MAANYAFQILNGNLAAAIDDYELNQRFMNDLATYRIYTAWLWNLLHLRARITRDGHLLGPEVTENGVVLSRKLEPVKAGTVFDEELFEKVWNLHYDWTRLFFAEQDRVAAERIVRSITGRADAELVEKVRKVVSKAYASGPFREVSAESVAEEVARVLGTTPERAKAEVLANAPRFDRSKAPQVMEFLKTLLLCPRFVQHNARILFALAEVGPEEGSRLIHIILGSEREEVERMVREGKIDRRYLELWDYVHDVRQ